jgi:mRNA-degrading endonuclease RelE of RelBE toxin-antitoxin system
MQVLLHNIPKKYLNRLNEPDSGHIRKALKGLEKEPPEGDIVPVVGQPGNFRLTIGSYRALFKYREDHIFVTHLDPRGQVYNKKNKGGKR